MIKFYVLLYNNIKLSIVLFTFIVSCNKFDQEPMTNIPYDGYLKK